MVLNLYCNLLYIKYCHKLEHHANGHSIGYRYAPWQNFSRDTPSWYRWQYDIVPVTNLCTRIKLFAVHDVFSHGFCDKSSIAVAVYIWIIECNGDARKVHQADEWNSQALGMCGNFMPLFFFQRWSRGRRGSVARNGVGKLRTALPQELLFSTGKMGVGWLAREVRGMFVTRRKAVGGAAWWWCARVKSAKKRGLYVIGWVEVGDGTW